MEDDASWRLLRWQLAASSTGAAGIQFAVIVPHLNEYKPFAVFFLIVAWFQATWAVLVITTDDRRLLASGLVVNTLVIAIWLWSNGRAAHRPGAWNGRGRRVGRQHFDRARSRHRRAGGCCSAGVYRSREPSRRVVVGAALLSWAVVIVLTAIAFTAETSGANGH